MALDDRERNFEKALKRELRANGAGGLDCPDAETLAAYHERMLSPEEMAAQKSHITACPRCQEILATLEVTEAIPSGAEDFENVLEESAAPEPVSAAAPVSARALEMARVRSASLREMPKRKAYLRWVVPAGAIAAGLLVWIAVNTSRPSMMTKETAPVTVAENREQKEAPLAVPKREEKAPAASSQMSDRLTENDRIATKQESEAFGTAGLAKTQSKPQDETTMLRGRAAAPPTYSHGPRQLQNNAQNQAQNQMPYQKQNNGQIAAQNQPTEFDKMVEAPSADKSAAALTQKEPRRNEKAMKSAPPPPPAVPAPAPGVSAGAAGGKAPRADVDAEAKKDQNKDQKIGAATETVEVTAEAQKALAEEKASDSATLKKLKETQSLGLIAANLRDASGPGVVRTPDERVFWLFTANGVVVKTEDGGKTTHAQRIGEGIKFLAGSAPDAKTCWLLAEKGIVMRTKDGGRKWTTVTAPADENFTMITGLDAMSALITDTSGRVTYSTTDGGATWKVVPQK
jgi:anti-sigma factor RsiW